MNEFNDLLPIKRLLQFIRVEKPYFTNTIDPNDFSRYYFVHATKNNRRIIAQSGAFVLAGAIEYKNVDSAYSFELTRFLVPYGKKSKILDQLDLLNINSRTMFPEIESTSRYIREKWKELE